MNLNVSLDFAEYYEDHMDPEVFFIIENNTKAQRITLLYAPENVEIELKYSGEQPNIKFELEINGNFHKAVIERSKVVWNLSPPKSLAECLDQIDMFMRDNREYQKSINDPKYIAKKMEETLDAKFKEICQKEGHVGFSFNRNVGFENLKKDIIEAYLHQKEYGFRIETIDGDPYHWRVLFLDFDPTSHIGQDIEHMLDISSYDAIELELKFSTTMFPVIPPKYDFIRPKLHEHTLKKIFHSGAFEKDVYNPLTKIGFLKNIKKVIEQYGQIDFGVGYNTIEDYLNEKNRREQQLCKPLIGQMIELGREYVEKIIKEQANQHGNGYNQGYGNGLLKESKSIQFNQFLLEGCPAYQRFTEALSKVDFESVDESGFFCWHGSDDKCIESICKTGFDPHRRSGQAYGRGEYFGGNPQISMGYSKGNCHLILTYILNKAPFTHKDQGIIVVDNPIDWKSSYCLPLMVITFGNGTEVSFLEKALN